MLWPQLQQLQHLGAMLERPVVPPAPVTASKGVPVLWLRQQQLQDLKTLQERRQQQAAAGRCRQMQAYAGRYRQEQSARQLQQVGHCVSLVVCLWLEVGALLWFVCHQDTAVFNEPQLY